LVSQIRGATEATVEMLEPEHEVWQVLRTGRPWNDLHQEDFPEEFSELRRLVEATGSWVRRLPAERGFAPVPLTEWEGLHAEWLSRESKRCSECGRTVPEWYDTWTPDGTARQVCVECTHDDLRGDR
jgi:hypothetical protein